MTSRIFALTLGLAIAAAGRVTSASAAAETLALVTVVADESAPATGLSPSEFTITEGKDRLDVLEAVPATDPLSIVLVVDTSFPADMSAPTPELRKALKSFTATILGSEPSAKIALYKVANAATPLTDFTSTPDVLEQRIDVIASGTLGSSAMLEGVVTAAHRLGDRPAPRRAIVCVGVGTAEASNFLPNDVAVDVRKSGATLWVVSVQRASDPSLTSRDTVWTRVTADTGGLRQNAVRATRVDEQLRTVANSLLSQYTLKMVRKKSGAAQDLKGKTRSGAAVLFTHWMR